MNEVVELKTRKSHIWDRHPNNWYREPSWPTRLLCLELMDFLRVGFFDPCAGKGSTLTGGREAGVPVTGADLIDRGVSGIFTPMDFYAEEQPEGLYPVPNIVCNPPYGAIPPESDLDFRGRDRMEDAFIDIALDRVQEGGLVCVFLLTGWATAETRSQWLERMPLWREYKVTPRPSAPPGEVFEEYAAQGKDPSGGSKDYSYYVFMKGHTGPATIHWLRRGGKRDAQS
ncbi:MAG: hypothetical protein AB8B85_15215 [Paracoccaceae bacterium]